MAGRQDMFDAIVMADERFHGDGYREGFEEGGGLGLVEGRQLGAVQGARIGSEIGCYRGFACAWQYLLDSGAPEKDSRKRKVLEALVAMIQSFPYGDPTYEKLHEDLDRIRGKFRQVRLGAGGGRRARCGVPGGICPCPRSFARCSTCSRTLGLAPKVLDSPSEEDGEGPGGDRRQARTNAGLAVAVVGSRTVPGSSLGEGCPHASHTLCLEECHPVTQARACGLTAGTHPQPRKCHSMEDPSPPHAPQPLGGCTPGGQGRAGCWGRGRPRSLCRVGCWGCCPLLRAMAAWSWGWGALLPGCRAGGSCGLVASSVSGAQRLPVTAVK